MVSIMARKMYGDRHLAEDMCQQAYLHMWQYIQRVDIPVEKMTVGCILHCADQRLIDHIRLKHNTPTLEWRGESDEEKLGYIFPAPSLEEEVVDRFERQERRALVRQRLGEIPKIYRAVILLRLGGREYKEISELLHIPLGTVKRRINHAKTHLLTARKGPARLKRRSA